MANPPEAYTETPVAVLWANHVWTLEAFARRVHPGNPLPIPAELSKAVPLMATPCRASAGDSEPFSPPTLRTVPAAHPQATRHDGRLPSPRAQRRTRLRRVQEGARRVPAGSVPQAQGADVTADDMARAFWDASRRRDPLLPRWEGLAVDIRRNRVADYQAMLDAGWRFVPPG